MSQGPRRFNIKQRRALYFAADGRCENCGEELTGDWHSDHFHPWSKGGGTDVINGQAIWRFRKAMEPFKGGQTE